MSEGGAPPSALPGVPGARHELVALLRLALPIAATQLGQMLLGAVDLAVVGRIGERELAAAGLGGMVFFSSSVVGMGLVLGIDPLVSQALGAGETKAARGWLWQGVWLALLVGVPLTVIGGALSFALESFGIEAATCVRTREYLVGRLPSVIPFLVLTACRSYLQAHGLTRPLLIGVVAANLLNLPLTILLGLGLGGWAGFGVAGAATANSIATLFQLGVAALALRRRGAEETAIDRPSRAPDRALLARASRIGTPIALTLLAEHGVFAIGTVLVARLGPGPLAGHHVALTLAALSFMVPLGIGQAASVRVGRAVGRGDRAGTRRAGFVAIGTGATFMLGAAAALALAPRPLAALIAGDQNAVAAALPLVQIAAAFQLFDGVQAVAGGALRGAGDTRAPMLANLGGYYVIALPAALWLGFGVDLGAPGVWWGLTSGLVVVAVTLTARFAVISDRAIARR